jgi:hypothetical protein
MRRVSPVGWAGAPNTGVAATTKTHTDEIRADVKVECRSLWLIIGVRPFR